MAQRGFLSVSKFFSDYEYRQMKSSDELIFMMNALFALYYTEQGAPDDASGPTGAERAGMVELGLSLITTKLQELNIHCVDGHLRGGSLVYLKEPDFGAHQSLYGVDTFCVLEKHKIWDDADGCYRLSGFDAKVKISGSDTWLCVGISPLREEDDDYSDLDDEDEDEDERREEITQKEKERIAFVITNTPGFRELKNQQQRQAFAKPIVENEIGSKEWGSLLNPAYEAAKMATELYELGIIPKRAKALASAGKNALEIGKELGISKQKAERAIAAEIPQYIADQLEQP